MKLLFAIILLGFSFLGMSQNTIDNEIIDCVVGNYDRENVDIKNTLDRFEDFLVNKKYMNDKSGKSYLSIYRQVADEDDVTITLDNFDDDGLSKKSQTLFFDCYQTRLAEVMHSNSPLKKLYKYLRENPIDPATPGDASKILLQVLTPADFKNDIIRYYSLYTLLMTSYSDSSTKSIMKGKRWNVSQKFEKHMLIGLDKASRLSVNGISTDVDVLKKTLKNFLSPSMDTLKSITLECTRETFHKDFSNVLELIKEQYLIAKNRVSQARFNQNFDSLTDEEKEVIERIFPQKIVVKDPK